MYIGILVPCESRSQSRNVGVAIRRKSMDTWNARVELGQWLCVRVGKRDSETLWGKYKTTHDGDGPF